MIKIIILLMLSIFIFGCSENKKVKIETINIKKIQTGGNLSPLGDNVEGL